MDLLKAKQIILGINIKKVYEKNNIKINSDYFESDFYTEHNLNDHKHDGENGEIKFLLIESLYALEENDDQSNAFFGLILEIGKEESFLELWKQTEYEWERYEQLHEIPLLDINVDEQKNKILKEINKFLPFLTVEKKDIKWYYIPVFYW